MIITHVIRPMHHNMSTCTFCTKYISVPFNFECKCFIFNKPGVSIPVVKYAAIENQLTFKHTENNESGSVCLPRGD